MVFRTRLADASGLSQMSARFIFTWLNSKQATEDAGLSPIKIDVVLRRVDPHVLPLANLLGHYSKSGPLKTPAVVSGRLQVQFDRKRF